MGPGTGGLRGLDFLYIYRIAPLSVIEPLRTKTNHTKVNFRVMGSRCLTAKICVFVIVSVRRWRLSEFVYV